MYLDWIVLSRGRIAGPKDGTLRSCRQGIWNTTHELKLTEGRLTDLGQH